MIYVASFRGQDAEQLARDLVQELRTEHRLEAFWFNRSEEEQQKQKQELARMREQLGDEVRLRRVRIPDEYAVLVGQYKDMEAARRDLEKLRKREAPRSVPLSNVFIVRQERNAIKNRDLNKVSGEAARMNPFATGFVSRNPLAPREVEPEEKFDPAWKDLNAGEPYSLLKCRKPWTLVVKVFQGATIVQGRMKPSIFEHNRPARNVAMERQLNLFTKTSGRDLGTAGVEANNLAQILRHKSLGYEAYVLHTRNSSIVTVGGFDGPNDHELLNLQRLLAGLPIGVVKLMEQPMPMEVPRP
jgi:hypothetical protein